MPHERESFKLLCQAVFTRPLPALFLLLDGAQRRLHQRWQKQQERLEPCMLSRLRASSARHAGEPRSFLLFGLCLHHPRAKDILYCGPLEIEEDLQDLCNSVQRAHVKIKPPPLNFGSDLSAGASMQLRRVQYLLPSRSEASWIAFW